MEQPQKLLESSSLEAISELSYQSASGRLWEAAQMLLAPGMHFERTLLNKRSSQRLEQKWGWEEGGIQYWGVCLSEVLGAKYGDEVKRDRGVQFFVSHRDKTE